MCMVTGTGTVKPQGNKSGALFARAAAYESEPLLCGKPSNLHQNLHQPRSQLGLGSHHDKPNSVDLTSAAEIMDTTQYSQAVQKPYIPTFKLFACAL
jgi:hypothetical protein